MNKAEAIEALTDVVSEDGTLTVRVSDGSKVKRILVLGDDRCGGLYYADSGDDDDNLIPVTNAAKIMETTDSRVCYGILIWGNDSISSTQIQKEVGNIIHDFPNDEWTIDDIVQSLPEHWKVTFVQDRSIFI